MGNFDIERKELEIRETLGELYGTSVHSIAKKLFDGAYILRSYSIRAKRFASFVSEELTQLSDSDPLRSISEWEEKYHANRAEKFLNNAKKLESEIAPKVFALYRLIEIIQSSDVDDDEKSSHLNVIRERIIEDVQEFEDSMVAESWKSMLALVRMQRTFENNFRKLVTSNKTTSQKFEGVTQCLREHQVESQQLFLNNQEWALAQIFVDIILDMRREIRDHFKLSREFAVNGELEKAEKQKSTAYSRRQSMKMLLRTSVEILLVGRQYGMAMSKVFKESEAEHESSDVFKLITTYVSDVWDPVYRKAQFYVTPMIELNELEIQHYFCLSQ